MRGYNGNKVVVEVELDEIKPAQQLAADAFTPGLGATNWAYCTGDSIWNLKEGAQPVYPQSARMHHEEGTVVLYGVIGENGRVSHLELIHRAGMELNQSALAAVTQWHYEHTPSCAAAKGPEEIFIDIDYYLLR